MSHQTCTVILAGVTAGAIGAIVGIIVGFIVFFISISVFSEDAAATVKAKAVTLNVDAVAAKKLVRTEARVHGSLTE